MLLLRREYRDGAEPPEIVLLHAEVTRHGRSAGPTQRFTRTVVPSDPPGRRVAHLPLPEPGEGERILVRYRFSTVRGGEERFSPSYEVVVPSDDAIADLYRPLLGDAIEIGDRVVRGNPHLVRRGEPLFPAVDGGEPVSHEDPLPLPRLGERKVRRTAAGRVRGDDHQGEPPR